MKKILFFASILVVFILFSAVSVTAAAKPSDFGLKEGDLISAIFSDDPDVYIINDQGYKRLFLNPEIFKFYAHLGGFINVKLVTPEVRDAFTTSGLFRNCEDNDQRVYGIDIEGEDSGQLHWVNVPGDTVASEDPDFFKKIFCINRKEFKWYPLGFEFKAVKEVPKYERMASQGIAREITSEQENIKEVGKVAICHYPPEAPNKFQEVTIDVSALKEHLSHRDTVGVCPSTPQLSQPIYVTPVPTGETMSTLYSITNVSPSGGETWTTGSVQYIKWTGNVPITHKIMTVRLRDSAGKGGAEYNLLTDTINDGLEQIIVPTTLAAGYYTLEIKTLVNGQTVFGRSNSPFSIVAPASALLPTSADFTPPIISNIKVVQGETTANSACVNFYWGTNEPSKSTLVYAASPLINQTYFSASSYNNYTTSHNLNGCDLSFNTPYYFKIYSTDVAGNTVESGEQVFTPTSTPVSTPIPASVPAPTSAELVDSFARCLTIKGTVMYGASTCPYCQKQKDLFGESFKYINYVECSNNTQNTQLCQEKGITAYPTWTLSNGTKLSGVQDLVTLSKYTGCAIPAPTPVPTPTSSPTLTPSVAPVSITVASPNGGEVFQKGTTQLIKWNSSNVSKIYIKLRKGNDTYSGPEGMITDVIPSTGGYYKWWIPMTLPDGNDYFVRIIDGNYTGVLDDSNAPFSIVTTPSNQTSPITILSPNGGEQWQSGNYYEVRWTNTAGKSVSLELMKGNNVVASWSPISFAVSLYNIGLPLPLEIGSDYRIRIATVDSSNVDYSDAPFSIVSTVIQTPVPIPTSTISPSPVAKSLKLISPNGGEQWTIGPEYTIRWENSGIENVIVELYKSGVYLAGLGGLGGGTPTSWTWNTISTPDFAPGSDFKIRIKSGQGYGPTSETGIYDESDNNFSISVTLPSPTTCDYLKSNSATHYYFGQCSNGGFDNVCFDKLYSTFQGCTRNTNNDCTVNNAHADQNILCPVSSATSQSNFSRNLTMGSAGDDVKQLQALLVNEANYPADLITGYFGRITRDAVKRLQEKYGVKPISGYFGVITRKALNAFLSDR